MTGPPPKWNDEEKVAKWVGEIIAEADQAEVEAARQLSWSTPFTDRDLDLEAHEREAFEQMERDAIDAATEGNFRPLAYLIDPRSAPNQFFTNSELSPRALVRIAGRMRGERRAKPGRGAPKGRRSPSYYAAAELPRIEKILRQHYPGEKKIKERAISIAAGRKGIEHDRLVYYLDKIGRKTKKKTARGGAA